jgi:MarR family transcriptional regulator, lower aerobic nicotinate degradation pathway regulator
MSTTKPEPVAPSHPVARELAGNTGFLLTRLGFAFKAEIMAALDRGGFEPHQYPILAILAEGAPETQATIAHALGLDPSRLVAVLDSFEEEGLIERQRDPRDRRRQVVTITAAGRRRLPQLRALAEELDAAFFAPLSPHARKELHATLLKLAAVHDPDCGF